VAGWRGWRRGREHWRDWSRHDDDTWGEWHDDDSWGAWECLGCDNVHLFVSFSVYVVQVWPSESMQVVYLASVARYTCYTSIMTSTAYAQCYQSNDDSVIAFIWWHDKCKHMSCGHSSSNKGSCELAAWSQTAHEQLCRLMMQANRCRIVIVDHSKCAAVYEHHG